MNGRKRKWKGGQGEEKGADFQIKFSGHLNKHLSQWSNGQGAAGGTCASWATLEAFQQDTSNKQHLKKHACSPSQRFASDSHPVSSSARSLQAFPVPFCPLSKGGPRSGGSLPRLWGPSPVPALLPGVGKSGCGSLGPFVPGRGAEEAEPSRPVTPRCVLPPLLLPFKNKRAEGES